MATYILLINWTEQGIMAIKEAPKRADLARAVAKRFGCELKDLYMTIGSYDLVALLEAPDDAAMATFVLAVASTGNVRTTTLKAFPEASYREIIAALP